MGGREGGEKGKGKGKGGEREGKGGEGGGRGKKMVMVCGSLFVWIYYWKLLLFTSLFIYISIYLY